MVATNHHQSGGGGCGICCTEQAVALQPSLEGCGAHKENTKNITTMGNQSIAGRLPFHKSTRSETNYTIHENSFHFEKN